MAGNGSQTMSPQAAAALLAASQSVLGRSQGPEQLLSDSNTWNGSAVKTIQLSGFVRLNRPITRFIVRVKFRVAVTVANYTSVSPEAPQNIIQNVQVTGTHAQYGAQTPINVSGATQFVRTKMVKSLGSDVYITDAGSNTSETRVADPGIPFTKGIALTSAASPYDVDIVLHVPVYPVLGVSQSVKRQASSFFFMPQDWGNTLQLSVTLGDKTAFGDPTGATVAFSGFGGAGSPTVEVYAVYALLGQFQYRMGQTGLLLQNEKALTGFTALAGAGTKLTDLQKRITPMVLVKTGVLDTHQSANVITFASLSDGLLDQTTIAVDAKQLRKNLSNRVLKSEYMQDFNTVVPTGYIPITFVNSQNILTSYRGDGLTSGNSFELDSQVASASAQNQIQYVQEQILGGPFPALGAA